MGEALSAKATGAYVARIALCAIIGAAMAVSLLWTIAVPVFESPDEDAHFDYGYSLATVGHFLRAGDATTVGFSPAASNLAAKVRLNDIAFRPESRIYAGYDLGSDRNALNAISSVAPQGLYTGARPLRNPLNGTYPPGYYTVLAIVMRLAGFPQAGIFHLLQAARLLSVALLGIGLFVWYRAIRAARIPRNVALCVIAVVGLSPLTSFVSSYVQPDNLPFVLIGAAFWLARRARDHTRSSETLAWLSVILATLWLTKFQFGLVVMLAVIPSVAFFSVPRRNVIRTLLTLTIPSVGAYFLSQWTMSGATVTGYLHGALTSATTVPFSRGFASGVSYLIAETTTALHDFLFTGGTVHESYWGVFGWLDTPMHSVRQLDTLTTNVLLYGTYAVLMASTVALLINVNRLRLVVRKRGLMTAIRIAVSDPIPLAYGLFCAVIFILYVISADVFGAQGRDFYPFEPAAVLVTIWYAPKAVGKIRYRRVVTALGAGTLGLFCLIYAPAAIDSILDRYYSPTPTAVGVFPTHVPFTDIASAGGVDATDAVLDSGVRPYGAGAVPQNATIVIRGWVVDPRAPIRPAAAVRLEVDRTTSFWAPVVASRPDVAKALNYPSALVSGYEFRLSVSRLKIGRHALRLRPLDAGGFAFLRAIDLPQLEVAR